MQIKTHSIALILLSLLLTSCTATDTQSNNVDSNIDLATAKDTAQQKPNILLVVADDLGMLDIGAFGSEIRTPSLDQLANNGVKLTNFYTSATCSPTRSMLFSGTDAHTAGIGNMIEHQGGASYFNDMMGLNAIVPDAHYRRNGETITELPDDFYASEYYADFIIDQLDSASSEEPFFAYLSFSAPHWPLQVKDEHVDLYKGRYDEGYEVLQAERVGKAQGIGIVPAGAPLAAAPSHVTPWSELDDQEKRVASRTMEIYSATVERMDYHLGRVMDYLEQKGELDNTLIIFMSDNGADGSDRSKLPGNDKWLPEAWDLSYENMGKKGSYVYPGPAWAWASGGNHRMYKVGQRYRAYYARVCRCISPWGDVSR